MFSLPASTLRYYEEQKLLTDVKKNSSGLRVYEEKHIHRLRTICCFKHAGMTISQLKKLFELSEHQEKNIDQILSLVKNQEDFLDEQINQLQKDRKHIALKLEFYSDMKKAIEQNKPLPEWKNYKER